ncbi:MAG: hypothetical protein ACHQF0_01950 [Chitinophagales bacterium]
MSEELKKKLYDYEMDPSGKMWSRIAAALDEEIHAEFSQKLSSVEVTPPVNAWEKIAGKLDMNVEGEYPTKLYNLEINPPSASWKKILALLDKTENLPAITSKRKIAPFVKFTAAACLIAFIVFGALKIFTGKSEHSVAVITVPPQNNPSTSIPDNQSRPSAQTPVVSNNLPKEGVSLAKTNIGSRKKNLAQQSGYMRQIIIPTMADLNSRPTNGFQQAVLRGEVPGNCSLISDSDPYLMFMNPDGYLIRISKKLAEALGCIYTNGNSENYKQCEDQIKKWREKIAQSPASSSPDNFMNILDIINSVRD